MRVKDLLSKKSSAIQSTTSTTMLIEAIKSLNEHNVGALLVIDDQKLAGIITERDVLHATAKYGSKIDNLKVEDVMTKNLITCGENESIDRVMEMMTDNRIRHLPILENDQLVGIISIGDVVKAEHQKIKAEADHLKDYIHGRR
jgi:CBS domain-containing protein